MLRALSLVEAVAYHGIIRRAIAFNGDSLLADAIPKGTMRQPEVSIAELGYVWFLRILGIICLVGALSYWSQLIGLGVGDEDAVRRFDALSSNARISYTALAMVLPFAGLGLWFQSSWGIVLWVGCVILQFIMYTVWEATFGTNPVLLALIFFAAIILAAYLVWLIIQRRNVRLRGY